MIKKISYERRVYESVDDNTLSKTISQKKITEEVLRMFLIYNFVSLLLQINIYVSII